MNIFLFHAFAIVLCCTSELIASDAIDALSPKAQELAIHTVQSEVQAWGRIDTSESIVQKKVTCFGGGTMFSLSGIIYEVFPYIGLYRVMALQADPKWLFMNLDLKPEETIILDDDAFRVGSRLSDRINACGSGILGEDISSSILSCGRIDIYRLLIIRVLKNDGDVKHAELLLNENDEISAIRTGKIWRPLSVKPE